LKFAGAARRKVDFCRGPSHAGDMTDTTLPGGLFVVGTPIGNLGDLSDRARQTLQEADLVLAEDTRRTGLLLQRLGVHARMLSAHKFNEASRLDRILGEIRAGARVALVTDSGMPAVSDPGARTVAACHRLGIPVTVIVGPSAVTAALAASGMPADTFAFGGFLPHGPSARARALARWLAFEGTVVLFESPHRLLRLLEELTQAAPDRPVCVCREMTKLHEETAAGTPAELHARFAARGAVRGEVTVVIGAAPRAASAARAERDPNPVA